MTSDPVKWFVYNALFAVGYGLMLPSFLLRMKRRGGYRARMGDRFGRYPDEVASALAALRDPVWIHAVSVGEVQVAGQLMAEWRRQDPAVRFVFSTTSSTGWKTAEKIVSPKDVLIYNPLDFPGCVRRALKRIRPRAVVLTETEIWPNFIRSLKRNGVPVFLVNARISDRSAPRYRALRGFLGEIFRDFTHIYAQSDLDAARLEAAGAERAAIEVTGSLKFDVAHRNAAKETELALWLGDGAPNDAPVLLGGSTWPGEDEMMLRAFKAIRVRHPEVKLVIAPRHFEKADAIEANIRAAGFACVRRSRPDQSVETDRPRVWLCDTTGEMMGLFGLARVAFVGKSLCAHGSQNMIEPCLCGVATVVGPYTENFRPVMSDLLAAEALVQTPDLPEPEARSRAVEEALARFFDDPETASAYGERARAAVARRCGVTARCCADLRTRLSAVPPPAPVRAVHRLRKSGWTALGLLLAWGISCPFVTPALNHAWRYLQMNPNRTYGRFVALSVATAFYPWCARTGARVCAAMLAREDPGADEFGVDRYRATRRLKALIPQLFPDCAAQAFDARFRSMADLKGIHREFIAAHGGYQLWCVGRWDYVFVAKAPDGHPVKPLDAETFFAAFSAHFEDFAAVGLYAPADLFACYVGDEEAVGPALAASTKWDEFLSRALPYRLAFRPEPSGGRAQVRPGYLTPEALPTFDWIARGKADGRVYFDFIDRVDALQRARRTVLLAFDTAEAGGARATNAIPMWASAAAVNPRDPLLANLADTLDLQGRRFLELGNVNGAMKCYENRLEIFPNDVAAIHNFGLCLKRGGHYAEATRVFLMLAKRNPTDETSLAEVVECAVAAHHEEDALKVLDILQKRHPRDKALKERVAGVKASLMKRNVKEYYK